MLNTVVPKFGAITINKLKDENGSNVGQPSASPESRSLRVGLELTGQDAAEFGLDTMSIYESQGVGYSMFMVNQGGVSMRDVENMVKDCETPSEKTTLLKRLTDVIGRIPDAIQSGVVDDGIKLEPFSMKGSDIKAKLFQTLAKVAQNEGFTAELAEAQKIG